MVQTWSRRLGADAKEGCRIGLLRRRFNSARVSTEPPAASRERRGVDGATGPAAGKPRRSRDARRLEVGVTLEVVEPRDLGVRLLELALAAVELSNDALALAERAAAHHDELMLVFDELEQETA